MFSFTETLLSSSSASKATNLLVRILRLPLSESTISRELEEHPDYPNFISISDVLAKYGIENIVADFAFENLISLPPPFIVIVKGKSATQREFAVVKKIDTDQCTFFNFSKNKWASDTTEEFKKRYGGMAMLAEADPFSGEANYPQIKLTERTARLIRLAAISAVPVALLAAGAIAFASGGAGAASFIFSILSAAGLLTSVLLSIYQLDQNNPLIQKICNLHAKAGCGSVLQSSAAKIAGVSWTAIGLSYFSGQIILVIFNGIGNQQLNVILGALAALALPYTIYSLYQQWLIVKKWCIMCLFVQAVLVLQFTTAIWGNWLMQIPDADMLLQYTLSTLAAFGIPFFATNLIMPLLENIREAPRVKRALNRLKRDQSVFNALLTTQKQVDTPENTLGITVGKPMAAFNLLLVSNPSCIHCVAAHKTVEALLRSDLDIQVKILYDVHTDENSTMSHLVKHFLAIAEKQDETLIRQSLNDWYLSKKKNYSAFSDKYRIGDNLNSQSPKIAAMQHWCRNMEIATTPSVFLAQRQSSQEAGLQYYQLPPSYEIDDLRYLLTQ